MPTINAHKHIVDSPCSNEYFLSLSYPVFAFLYPFLYEFMRISNSFIKHLADILHHPQCPEFHICFNPIAYPPSDFIPFPSRCATCIWAWTYSCTFLPESPTIPQFPPILGISYIHFASISPSSNWSNSPPPAWRTGTRLPELWTSFGRLLKTGNNGSYLSPKWNKQPAEGILLLIRSSSFELHIVWEKRKIAVSDAGAEGDRRPNRNV